MGEKVMSEKVMDEKVMSYSRLTYLDFLRGIAVLGLLTMNVAYMGLLEINAIIPTQMFWDKVVVTTQILFLDGRFRSLFCLLFGIGIFLQFTRFESQNLQTVKILKSRLHWLFIFGLCHCIFIWYGDILIVYALSGLVVMTQLGDSASKLFKRGCIYFSIGIAIQVLIYVFSLPVEQTLQLDGVSSPLMSIKALYLQNLLYAVMYIMTFPILTMFEICGLMYLGISLFRLGFLKNGFSIYQLWTLGTITLVSIFIELTWLQSSVVTLDASPSGLMSITGLTMALLFWHWVLKSKCYESHLVIVSAIKSVGRRAFSFYILQSLIITTLLRYILPIWEFELTLINYFIVAISFIPVQLFIAFYLEKVNKTGPLEYLWRQLVVKPNVNVKVNV